MIGFSDISVRKCRQHVFVPESWVWDCLEIEIAGRDMNQARDVTCFEWFSVANSCPNWCKPVLGLGKNAAEIAETNLLASFRRAKRKRESAKLPFSWKNSRIAVAGASAIQIRSWCFDPGKLICSLQKFKMSEKCPRIPFELVVAGKTWWNALEETLLLAKWHEAMSDFLTFPSQSWSMSCGIFGTRLKSWYVMVMFSMCLPFTRNQTWLREIPFKYLWMKVLHGKIY